MTARPTGRSPFHAACALAFLVVAPILAAAPRDPSVRPAPAARGSAKGVQQGREQKSAAAPEASPVKRPRAFLIYLSDGGDPIVVKEYVEENGQIRFEKYGGWVGIPKHEILRIVPDEPDVSASLPPAPDPAPDPVPTATAPPATGAADTLYVAMRGGPSVKATAVTSEGDRVRVTAPDGSFTVPRSDLLGVLRISSSGETPEAWMSVLATEFDPTENLARPAAPGPAVPGVRQPRMPHPSSDRPHLLRLANGQLLRVEGFWIEEGEIRFRRLGGFVGVALAEVARIIPEELAPVSGRTPVRFSRQLGPDLLEVRVRSGTQRVRLIGVEPAAGTRTGEDPWGQIDRGLVVYLEFDRQRYDPRGDWLAYVFLPSGRMLNAELIRLGLARPRADGRNLRYLDLFHELVDATAWAGSARRPDP